MTPEQADEPAVLRQARDRCLKLLDDLRRDRAALDVPSRGMSDEALAEGRAAYDRAAAAAAELLRQLEVPLPATPHSPPE